MIARLKHDSDLVAVAARLQSEHAAGCSSASQKERGQFFTPPAVARQMASMLTDIPTSVRVLDPGAGAGILTVAVCERIARLRTPRTVEVHAYETDRKVLPLLHATLAAAKQHLARAGHALTFVVHPRDFILHGPGTSSDVLFHGETFDIAILNPPYLKISKESRYALAMRELVHGQPNIYSLFMAAAAQCLENHAQFVAITPRSFCNGPYFRAFRQWFLSRVSVERFHLFESRTDTFSESEVLQESVITYGRRSPNQSSRITISHSSGPDVPLQATTMSLDTSFAIHGRDRIIRLPASELDTSVMKTLEEWPHTFSSLGLRVSTGPVVLFRAKQFVRRGRETNDGIPLLSIQNVRPFQTVWPSKSDAKTLSFLVTAESGKLLVPSSNYVLLRRFSAKEEARRLVASALFAGDYDCERFAIENHLNYVYHAERELTRDEAVGIMLLFNSRLFDIYFRTISGNTQVNAAEIRALPFPTLSMLSMLGRAAPPTIEAPLEVDRTVLHTLGINGTIKARLAPATD